MNYLNIFKDQTTSNNVPEDELAMTFNYELDHFQKEGIYRIYKNENILITAKTGSGKTLLALYAIAQCKKLNKKVIYTSPIKSLSNQKYAEFINIFGKDGSIGILTGDIKMNPDAQCLIMTTEILRNLLYRNSMNNNLQSIIDINDIGIVIFDEVHYINDLDRGKIWEESIVLLPKNIRLVMLSATIDKAEEFATWIGNIKETPINLIETSHRVVPLKHYFWKYYIFDNNGKDEMRWEMCEIMDEKNTFKNYDLIRHKYKIFDINKIMDKLVDYLVEEKFIPALFFKFSRKKCETLCKTVRKSLLTFEELAEVERIFHFQMRDYKKTYEKMPQYQDVYQQLLKGVVYHHSGLIPILKEIIEILYSKGLVKILFATETFAIGVNMPTKTVLFTELEKYDNNGLRTLRTDEYLQMSGRAGRRGIDKFGSVIILPCFELPTEVDLRNIMKGHNTILQSKFKLSYQFVLKTLLSSEFNIETFLSKTLIMNENNKIANGITDELIELNNKIILYQENIDEKEKKNLEQYEKIMDRLNDKLFTIKKKDKDKMDKELKMISSSPNFQSNYEIFKKLKNIKKEYKEKENEIWSCNNWLKNEILKMNNLLEEEGYIGTKKGISAMGINECNELIFTEMIFQGVLDDLNFGEIIALLSSFIDEKDPSGEEKYISDLNVSNKIINGLKKIIKIGEYFMKKEEEHKIYIGTNYQLYLDFIEPSYIWANGGSIAEVYQTTSIYDGNFVKAILRINNICENVMEICNNIERYDLCSKLEGYNEKLIRDITSINSLYIQ